MFMGRIQIAYEFKFRMLLQGVNARRLEPGIRHLLNSAEQRRQRHNLPPAKALADVCGDTRRKIERWLRRTGRPPGTLFPVPTTVRFLCDAGLGGLARWLRAAGYEADWRADIEDDALLAEARRLGALVVTTDSMLMERRLVRQRVILAVWVPPALGIHQQLSIVLDELALPLQPPRCMMCGGPLELVDKQTVRDRIPPKTWRWLDEFFLCARCGRLFWHGTHWERIRARLQNLPK